MRQENSERRVRTWGIGLLAAIAGAGLLAAAGPAQARDEFKNGFEDELGRIAAHSAVGFGLSVLTGGYYPAVVPVPVAPVVQASYYGPAYPRYYGPRTVVVKHSKHRHGKYCHGGHGGYHGAQYGYRDRYDRHDRWDDDRGRGHGYRGGRGRGW